MSCAWSASSASASWSRPASGLPEDDPSFADGWALGPRPPRRRSAPDSRWRCQLERGAADTCRRRWPTSACARPRSCRCRAPATSRTSCSCSTAAAASRSAAPICTCSPRSRSGCAIAAEDRERAVAIERLAQSGHLLAPHLDSDSLLDAAAELMQRLTMSDDAWIVGVADGVAYRAGHYGTAPEDAGADGGPSGHRSAGLADGRRRDALDHDGTPWSSRAAAHRPVRAGDARRRADRPALRHPQRSAAVRRRGHRDRHDLRQLLRHRAGERRALPRAAPPGATRDPAHRPGQPANSPGSASTTCSSQRIGAVHRAALLRPGRVQGGQRPARPRGRRRDCSSRSPRGCRRACARRICWPGSAATSSSSCSARSRARRRRPRSGAGWSRRCTSRSSWTTSGSPSRRASAGCSAHAARPRPATMLRDADAAMYVAKSRGPGAGRGLRRRRVAPVAGPAQHPLGAAAGPRPRRVRGALPADRRARHRPSGRLRGAAAVDPSASAVRSRPTCSSRSPRRPARSCAIGTWVLEQACRQLAAWQRLPGWSGLHLNVNLSAAQLWQADVADQIAR